MLSLDRNVSLSLFDDSKRALAKLMAMENITVQIIAGVSTASFDPVTRVLTLPDWPQLTVDQIDTQIGHEVGHALFTNHSYLETLAQARKDKLHPGLMSYINVIEDTRIERKMREAYPGLKATFYDGRGDFARKGPIFQVADSKHVLIDGKKSPVAKMPFIDRINLFYKIGAFIDIPFSEKEWAWIPIIDKAWSTERAIEIAKLLHEEAKDDIMEQKAQQEQRQQMTGESGDGEESEPMASDDSENEQDGDSDDADGAGSVSERDGADDNGDSAEDERAESGDDKKTSKGVSKDGEEKESTSKKADGQSGKDKKNSKKLTPEQKAERESLDPASSTDNALAQALQKLGEDAKKAVDPRQQIRHLLLKPLTDADVKRRTITAAKFADDVLRSRDYRPKVSELESRWNNQYLSTAENMSAEFLRRKTAKNLMHARVGKTGRLDMTKLAKYRYAEDLFKRVLTVPNGQSHGIVMMIDGSSSMNGVFSAVLDQVLLFAHFAFRTNIPFEAYMFSDRKSFSVDAEPLQTVVMPDTGHLVGLINTTTDRAAFKRQCQAVLVAQSSFGDYATSTPHMTLGNTPLFAGMMVMERHVARMKKSLHLDKIMTVVISDGQDNKNLYYTDAEVDYAGRVNHSLSTVGDTAFVVRDMVTKKNHMFVHAEPFEHHGKQRVNYTAPANAVITMLFDVMKSRHDARSIYMYLVGNATDIRKYGRPAVRATEWMLRAGVTASFSGEAVSASMDTMKQYVLPVSEGVTDCAIVIAPAGLVLLESEFSTWNSKGATQTQIQQKYIDSMKKAVSNRTFVNSIVPFLA